MAFRHQVLLLLTAAYLRTIFAKVGYFWHITDLHYNHLYSPHGDTRNNCWQSDARGSYGYQKPLGKFGDPACDSPWSLIEAAAHHMRARHGENVEFVLWTGDAISSANSAMTIEQRLALLRNVTDLLSHTFSSQFVFPVLGHDDPPPSPSLNQMWMHWLPTEALQTFETGGYYTIEQSHSKLRIVALNTNLFLGGRARQSMHSLAMQQWSWLEKVLAKAAQKSEVVFMVGHVAPGVDERGGGALPPAHTAYSPEHNQHYLKLVRRFAHVIAGQFFGHLHSDTFRVIYSEEGVPISWILLAPSVSPNRVAGGFNNPGLRLYKFNSHKGHVIDYTQHYLDLSTANKLGEPDWSVEYNLTHYYGLHNISPASFHELAEKFSHKNPGEKKLFSRYIRSNGVRMYSASVAACERDLSCAHEHYCAITHVDYSEYSSCMETAASALASSTCSTNVIIGHQVSLLCLLLLIIQDIFTIV